MSIFGQEVPFATYCGVEEVGLAEGRTRLRMRLRPEHENQLGMAHGGAICTLLDVALGSASRQHAGTTVMTLDMQVAFLAPGRGTLLAEGRVLKAGRSIIFAEAEVRDEAGALVAKASGVFKPARREGAPGPA